MVKLKAYNKDLTTEGGTNSSSLIARLKNKMDQREREGLLRSLVTESINPNSRSFEDNKKESIKEMIDFSSNDYLVSFIELYVLPSAVALASNPFHFYTTYRCSQSYYFKESH